jgi:DNA-binding NarL/FixJ family response regulator
MKRFLIADDHEAVRSGLRAVLEQHPGWEVVAEANDGSNALAAAIANQPDVAIVDFSMPRMTGVEVTRRIKEYPLHTEVLIFTVHNSGLLAQQAFQAGARAFLLKSDANKLLLAAIESLLVHKPFCTDSCVNELNDAWTGDRHRYHQLSPRERLVVKLVAEGYTNKRISAMLDLSVKTTEAHRAAAMRKLEVNSTAGLVRYAVRANLVES